MIKWNDGTDTGLPKFVYPKSADLYELEVYTFGSHENPLWSARVLVKSFPICGDHFRTQDEAFDFVVSVVNLLELKYPNAKCSNFSFLTKE